MIIYNDGKNTLERTRTGKRSNGYKMTFCGWYGGGFSARNDTAALEIFRDILKREEARPV